MCSRNRSDAVETPLRAEIPQFPPICTIAQDDKSPTRFTMRPVNVNYYNTSLYHM